MSMVRRALPGDRAKWLELVCEVKDSFPGLEMESYTATLARNIARGTALCAFEGEELAGILLFSPRQRCLSCMAVRPGMRRRGVASALVRRMLVLMPAGDVSVTTFRAGDAKGAAPRALYARFGFEPAEELMEFDYPVQRMVLRAERRAGDGRGDARPDAAQHMEEADGNQEGRVH